MFRLSWIFQSLRKSSNLVKRHILRIIEFVKYKCGIIKVYSGVPNNLNRMPLSKKVVETKPSIFVSNWTTLMTRMLLIGIVFTNTVDTRAWLRNCFRCIWGKKLKLNGPKIKTVDLCFSNYDLFALCYLINSIWELSYRIDFQLFEQKDCRKGFEKEGTDGLV